MTVGFANMSLGDPVDPSAHVVGARVSKEWAYAHATGRGVRVCLIDSGLDTSLLPGLDIENMVTVEKNPTGGAGYGITKDTQTDISGHGTACASIIHSIAPDVVVTSVRILGPDLGAAGLALLAGLEWAIDQRFDLVNLSLSTRRTAHKEALHDLSDEAYFAGTTIVASAHNSPVASYPWRFPSVVSVGSHEQEDSSYIEVGARPPVEFYARGVNITCPWHEGTATLSGNSFATPHVTGYLALIKSRHPRLGTLELKHALANVSDNLGEGRI